jgi:hypothetical protein
MDHAMHHFDEMTRAEKVAGILVGAILLAVVAAHFLH